MTTPPTMRTPFYDAAVRLNAEQRPHHGWWAAERFGPVESDESELALTLALADLSAAGKLIVHGRESETVVGGLTAEVPPIGESAAIDNGRVYRLRADQFFLSAYPGAEAQIAERLETARTAIGTFVTVTDVTHGRAQLGLLGPQAGAVLGRLCGLDFAEGAFPDGASRQSSVAKTTQLILRHDLAVGEQHVPAYSLIGARSLGDYLWQTVVTAGRDFDLQPLGWRALAPLLGWPVD